MHTFLANTAIVLLICTPATLGLGLGIYIKNLPKARGQPTGVSKRELDRREYDTMLRHRRRTKIEEQFRNTSLLNNHT